MARLTRYPVPRQHRRDQVIFCVRGVISPLLANLYMNRFLKYWRITAREKAFLAQVVNYADDFVILSRRHAAEARDWTRQVMTRLGLTLNETKTTLKEARRESFDFLGYTFGPQHYRKDGHGYLGAAPSKKSVARLRQKINDVLVPSNIAPWPEVRDRLNSILRGWSTYFSHGTRLLAYRAVDQHVADRVRHFQRRRHQLPSHGTRVLADDVIFGPLGVSRLRSREKHPQVAATAALLERSMHVVPAKVIVQLQQVFERVLIVRVNCHPLRTLGRGVDGIEGNRHMTFKMPFQGLVSQAQRLAGAFGRGPVVVIAAGFRVRTHRLKGIGPSTHKHPEIITHEFTANLN
jgi:hypothetical protein